VKQCDNVFMKNTIMLLAVLSFPVSSFAKDGRYQMTNGKDLFEKVMIDTQTGKLWKYRCSAGTAEKCLNYAWVEETVQGITIKSKDFDNWMDRLEKESAVK
jgi:hypothetical protein